MVNMVMMQPARKGLFSLFELSGGEDDLVPPVCQGYRSKLFALLHCPVSISSSGHERRPEGSLMNIEEPNALYPLSYGTGTAGQIAVAGQLQPDGLWLV